jgi:hypothetical protein
MLCRVWIVIGYCSKSDSHWGRLQESPALDSKGLRGKSRSAPRSAVKCAENRGFRPRLMFERFCGRGRKRKQAVVSTFLTPHSTVPVNREMTCIRQTRGSDRIGELRRPAWVECGPACPQMFILFKTSNMFCSTPPASCRSHSSWFLEFPIVEKGWTQAELSFAAQGTRTPCPDADRYFQRMFNTCGQYNM